MPKIIDANIQLPILVERIEPNPIIVPKPTLISKTSSSIEVEQTFQCDVDYYGGVGIEQNGAVDTKLVKNPNTMTATLTGLTQDTEYTIKGVGLPILGNETISEGLVVRTKVSPIPGYYQLVEYLSNKGQTTQRLRFSNIFDVDNRGYFRKYDFYVRNSGGYWYGFFFGTFGNKGWWEVWNGGSVIEGDAHNIPTTANFIKYTVDLPRLTCYINDTQTSYPITSRYNSLSTELCCYRRSDNWQTGYINGHIQKIIVYGGENSDVVDFALYPVYRKSDSKPGMYDIINNRFYTNQGSGEFFVGPDKEWDE